MRGGWSKDITIYNIQGLADWLAKRNKRGRGRWADGGWKWRKVKKSMEEFKKFKEIEQGQAETVESSILINNCGD